MDAVVPNGPRASNLYKIAYFESRETGPQVIASLLPSKSDPDYLWILAELVRLDFQQSLDSGEERCLEEYAAAFPELFADPALVRQLMPGQTSGISCFDAYHTVVPHSSWMSLSQAAPESRAKPPLSMSEQAEIQSEFSQTCAVPVDPLSAEGVGTTGTHEHALTVSVTSDSKSKSLHSKAHPTDYPEVGDEFLDFKLLSVLGVGAFSKVFLAEQKCLANRLVALKVTTRPTREPQRLAKLRHTNIVPIYSVHDEARPLQAVCMPYLGRQTLADLLNAYRDTGVFPHTDSPTNSTIMLIGKLTLKSERRAAASKPATPPSPHLTHWSEQAKLTGSDHESLVLWVLQRLAEGLAHAHDMGILHLDLKPGNVLFADDGEPLLLDFNLSHDRQAQDREKAGGTLPYMAPEQLMDYRISGRGESRIDERTDLFALGVMAYELLTGELPYPMPSDKTVNVSKLITARRKAAPRVRSRKPNISPGTDAIVAKLLNADPAKRYQSANQLLVDVQRHRNHLPLKYAPNRSPREAFMKWRKRNPGLTLYVCLVLALLSTVGFWYAAYRQEAARLRSEVIHQTRGIKEALIRGRVDLTSMDEPLVRQQAREQFSQAIAPFGFPNRPEALFNDPIYLAMNEFEQSDYRNSLGEVCLLIAHSHWLDHRKRADQHRTEAFQEALRWNSAAAKCWTTQELIPHSVERQRQNLHAEIDNLPVSISKPLPDQHLTTIDRFLWAAEFMALGEYSSAIPLLEELTNNGGKHFAGFLMLAIAQQQVGDYSVAIVNYKVAQALVSHDPRPAFNRGLLLMSRNHFTKAEQEFSEAIQRDVRHANSYYHRAVCRTHLQKPSDALDDVNRALELGASRIQGLMLRASLHELLGNHPQARADLAASEQAEATDAVDYMARGTSLIARNPREALRELTKATEKNPMYFVAWQNIAYIYADILRQPDQALVAQSKAVDAAPDVASTRIGRAVLLARLNRRQEAHLDAEKALLLSTEPMIAYQACCVYALTAKQHPEDTPRALALLRQAYRSGFRDFSTVQCDPDLEAIRTHAEFQAILTAGKELGK